MSTGLHKDLENVELHEPKDVNSAAAGTSYVADGLGSGSWQPVAGGSHAATHEDGGADEISVSGLSGVLSDPQTPTAHSSSHQHGGSDEVATGTPAANAIPKADGTGLLAAGWIPATAPASHASSHENGGGDEISVEGLSGLLGDAQTPLAHATTHESGGADEIAHQDLAGAGSNTHAQIDSHISSTANPHATDIGNIGSGTLAELNIAITDATLDDSGDPRDPNAHASSHSDGGSDEIDAGDLGSGGASAGTVLTADGAGGSSWVDNATTDERVGVTGSDTSPGSLDDKITPGDGLTRSIVDPGADESYQLDVALTADNQHGDRGGGSLHADATTSVDGFMSAADKSKLDGVAPGAQPGDVVGPGASTDKAIARWDGVDGDELDDSVVTLEDNGDIIGTDFVSTRSGTVTRVGGEISQISLTGGRTLDVTRSDGVITSITDGVRTWTINRDGDGVLTGWTVS